MNEKEIFQAAVELSDPAQRQAYLAQACGGNVALRARVEALLAAHAAASSEFLNVPAMEQTPPTVDGQQQTLELPATGGGTVDTPQSDDDESDAPANLSFLQPSAKPGSLGRLGHYEILQVLGQGAFGIVFKAFDEKLHRHVAVKAMSPELASTSPPRKRFLREARSVAALKHENIIQIYSVDEQPLPYLAMEFVDGQTLQQKLDGAGPLEVHEILHLGRQMAAGLAAAHEKGLIHRDIKPGNILLEAGAEQKVKITDFGLARAADDATMTRTGTIAGTPMYMAPEQAMGQTLDQRADLFSLGSVLYQMTCGRPPFRGANAMAVLKRVIDEMPRPLQDILPEVPVWLCAIIEKLHAKNPDERYQTAKEVADVLARCQNELQVNCKVTCVKIPERIAPAVSSPPSSTATTTPAAASAKVEQPSSKSKSRGPLIFAATAVVLIVGFTLFELTRISNFYRKPAGNDQPVASGDIPSPSQGLTIVDAAGSLSRDKLSPETLRFVSADSSGNVPEELVGVLGGVKDRVTATPGWPSFTPDGTHLVVPCEDNLVFVNWETGYLTRTISVKGTQGRIHRLHISPNGKYFLCRMQFPDSVVLGELQSGKTLKTWGNSWIPMNEPFFPDGERFAIIRDSTKTTEIYSAETLQKIAESDIFFYSVSSSPNKESLVVCDYEAIRVFTSNELKLVRNIEHKIQSQYRCVKFSPDGSRLAVASDGQLSVFSWPSMEIEQQIKAPAPFIAWDSTGKKLWALEHDNPRGTLFAVASGNRLKETKVNPFGVSQGGHWSFWAQHPRSSKLAVLAGNAVLSIARLDTESGELSSPQDGHYREIGGLATSPDGLNAATSALDGSVLLWDLRTCKVQHCLRGFSNQWVFHVCFSPDARLLLGIDIDGELIVWNRNGEEKYRIATGSHAIEPAFTPDSSKIIVTRKDGSVAFYDALTGVMASTSQPSIVPPHCKIAFSPDGNRLAMAGDGSNVILLDPNTGTFLKELKGVGGNAFNLTFMADGDHLFSTTNIVNAPIRRWNLVTGEVCDFAGYEVPFALTCQPGGGLMTLGGNETNEPVLIFNGMRPEHPYYRFSNLRPALGVHQAFTPDGKHLLAGGNSGIVLIFRLPNTPDAASEWLSKKLRSADYLPGPSE